MKAKGTIEVCMVQLYGLCHSVKDNNIGHIFEKAVNFLHLLKNEDVRIIETHNIITKEIHDLSCVLENPNGTLEFLSWVATETGVGSRKHEICEYAPYLQLFNEKLITCMGGKIELSLEQGNKSFIGQWNDVGFEDLKRLVESPNCPAQKKLEDLFALKEFCLVLTIAHEVLTEKRKVDMEAMINIWKAKRGTV